MQKLLICFIFLVMTACQKPQEVIKPQDSLKPQATLQQEEKKPIPQVKETKIAILLPLSGVNASVGQSLLNGAMLASREVPHTKLIPLDSGGTPEMAIEAVKNALSQQPEMIIGPLFAKETKAIAPYIGSSSIPVISLTTDPKVINETHIPSAGFLVSQQVSDVLRYAWDRGYRRFALLTRQDEYGQNIAEAFKDFLASRTTEPASVFFYESSGKNLTEQTDLLVRNKDAYDAIMIADDGIRLKNAALNLVNAGIDFKKTKLLGTLLWQDLPLFQEALFQGAWYPSLPEKEFETFAKNYQRFYNNRPHRLSSIPYDLVKMSPELKEGRKINLLGVDGSLTLLPEGGNKRSYQIKEVP